MENSLSPNMYTISDFFASGGSRALMATYGLNYNIQGPLPSNQWQLEAEHWFKGQLASIQGAFVSVAAGPSTPELERVAVKPPKNNPTYGRFQKMCKNQVRHLGRFSLRSWRSCCRQGSLHLALTVNASRFFH